MDGISLYLGQIFQSFSFMVRVEKVIACLIVNLQVGEMHGVCVVAPLRDFAENEREGARDDSTVHIARSSSSDGVGLARPCLAVCKNSAIVAFQRAHNHLLSPKIRRQKSSKQS